MRMWIAKKYEHGLAVAILGVLTLFFFFLFSALVFFILAPALFITSYFFFKRKKNHLWWDVSLSTTRPARRAVVRDLSPMSLPLLDPASSFRAVLIDDDILIREGWSLRARKNNIPFLAVEDFEDLKPYLEVLSTDTPIFVDVDLKSGRSGVDVLYELNQLGFSNLFLSTGYPSEEFSKHEFIKGIYSKEPPSWMFGKSIHN